MKYLIVGGTGTLGSTLIEKLYGMGEIICFSRDELKQQGMKSRFPDVRYVIGDIRDKQSLMPVMAGVDTVFLVAALKHVDVLEENPTEAIKTNIQGTINVAEAAMASGVKHVVFSSTDKAVLPINTYGMTKAISERYLLNLNMKQDVTRFSVFVWGNVAGSRGSVIHTFASALREGKEICITDARMTRFWIHIDDAVNFMLTNYQDAFSDRRMIPPMKAAKVIDLAHYLAEVLDKPLLSIKFVGLRAGEKIHESLVSNHDYCLRSDNCEQFSPEELKTLIKRVVC